MSIFNKIKKKKKEPHVFENVLQNSRGHFLLHFYAAIYRLLYHLYTLSNLSNLSGTETKELTSLIAKYSK